MIPRLGPLVLLVLLLAAAASLRPVAAQAPIPPVSIDVDGLTIALAPADADAFQRRLNQPPLLRDRPEATGRFYPVTAEYWDAAVRRGEDEPAVDPQALYFPDGGFVRARQDGEEAWFVLDLRQRAILDRYIRFGHETGREAPRPSALEIIALAAQAEPVGVEAGNGALAEADVASFWEAIDSIAGDPHFRDPPQPPHAGSETGYWLTFSLLEGRTQQYFVDTAAGTMTDALGTESYDVSAHVGGALPADARTLAIDDQEPAGSLIWWPVAAGGGLTLLGLAFWLRRRELAGASGS